MTIIYYGAVVTDPDLLRPLVDAQPVLGIFGEEDRSIPTQELNETPNHFDLLQFLAHTYGNIKLE